MEMTNLPLALRWSVAAVAIYVLTGCISVTDTDAENGSDSDEDRGLSDPQDLPDLPDGETVDNGGVDANGGIEDGSFTITVLGNLPFLSGPPFEDHPITTRVTD
ncbi:hypothetical protein, partial [Aquisalimonas sp.]|uniref:hypothetical protein n=1 Tax=Aquisalimonas sp. TaxID=1872621 RepID=UPI0025C443E9